MKADPKYLVVLLLAMFGVLAITGDQRGASPSGPGVLLAAPQEEDEQEAEQGKGQEGEGPEFRVIGLEHQPAQEAMETLEELFESDLFDKARDKVAFAVNEPANAIVVVGPERAVDLLEDMLRELDELTAKHRERMKDRQAERREMGKRKERRGREQMGEQMRKMREQMERFFREYDRPREHDRRGSRLFEGPGFRFEFHPDIERPKIKKL